MDINNIRSVTNIRTENGTSIVQSGSQVDKDIFLKMLVAQMTNQDPFNTQDPTQYITQLSQFSSLEQMMALNDSMDYLIGVNSGMLINSAVETASSLIGNDVEFSSPDENGVYKEYSGIVESVSIKEGSVYLEVKIDGNEETREFEYSTLTKVNKK